MTFTIRKMQDTDRDQWLKMRCILWDDLSVDGHMADIDWMLSSTKRWGYIAFCDTHSACGFSEVTIRHYANGCTEQPVPFLEGIWVDPKFRHKGLGRTFISTLAKDLLSAGYSELCSDAHIDNTLSHQAHENWGFNETDRVVYFRKALK